LHYPYPAPPLDIRKLLIERIDTRKQAVGIVVGVIDSNGRRIISYGSLAKGSSHRVPRRRRLPGMRDTDANQSRDR